MNKKIITIALVALIILGGMVAVIISKQNNKELTSEQTQQNDQRMMAQDEIPEKQEITPTLDENVQASASTYLDYSPEVIEVAKTAQKSGRRVVLFFHANWCPFCIAADKNFKANIHTDEFPKNITLIKTDYDTQTELKKKYGVTYQHTFVQIDSDGNQLTKWIGGETTELAKNIK